jgi:putative transposase
MELLLPGQYYHIYNHANGDDNLFREQENYRFFLQQYNKFIAPIADTYAYCLMPNHFHVLLRIKELSDIQTIAFPKFQTLEKLETSFVSKQFANFFSSYTQAFNKMYQRRGSLFIKNFKRKSVRNEDYLCNLIAYIHLNSIHHGFVQDIRDWQWTSYHTILASFELPESSWIKHLFPSVNSFIDFHLAKAKYFLEYQQIENDIL